MQNIRILWADDEIDHLKAHLLFLSNKGYEVDTVSNGLDAVEEVKKVHYDVVLLDENMPGISGLDALKEIKELQPNLPVVMITKSEEEHIMEDAIGSKIADYLIKPVNPNQILLSLKKIVDHSRLVSEGVTSRYQQEFRKISMTLMDYLDFDQWKELYKKLVYFELELESAGETGMKEVLENQKSEANREWSKYVSQNYIGQLPYDDKDAPVMSHTVMRKEIVPEIDSHDTTYLLLIDNLRFDQWRILQPLISQYFRVDSEDMYMSILPTTTQYCRNSIFSGLLPSDIEKRFPDKWSNDEEDGGKNMHEEFFVNDLNKRLRKDYKTSYFKILNMYKGKELAEKIPNLAENDLNVIVYNFVDSLSHARTDYKIVRELAEDEAAYRSITRSWFEHSPLFEIMKKIAEQPNARVVVTTDHGSVRVNNFVKVVGDKKTTTNLRYKTGRSLSLNKKEVFAIADPAKAGLPSQHLSSTFVFCKENDFFVYPNNLNHYAKYYKDTFQHGGISMEEMLIPLIMLSPK
jgi:DNA-binding response OmpR family regulator